MTSFARTFSIFTVLLVVTMTSARAAPIESKTIDVGGEQMHYLTAGDGEVVLLIHGYAQSAHMWKRAIPQLADRFTVIAPDLPGFGDSAIPAEGADIKRAAMRIHALAQKLGVSRVRVVGHDIGLMVAYAYAAMYPNEVEKLVMMDAFLPGIGDWLATYHNPALWHFFFTGPTAEALVRGRERIYFDHYWNDFAADPKRSVSEADRRFYTAQFARPGRMRAGWQYFVNFPRTATDFAVLAKTKLAMPVLVISGEEAAGNTLAEQAKLVADDVTSIVLESTGHWVLDERPKETLDAIQRFL